MRSAHEALRKLIEEMLELCLRAEDSLALSSRRKRFKRPWWLDRAFRRLEAAEAELDVIAPEPPPVPLWPAPSAGDRK